MGIFSEYAPKYAASGLITIPVSDQKIPMVKNWRKFRRETHTNLGSKYSNANVGILDGTFCGITRVDVDDPNLLQYCLERFGDTNVIIRTPGGGYHLGYKSQGEKRVLKYEDKDIDILGVGGFGLVPPSETDSGIYEFISGSIESILTDLVQIQGLNAETKQYQIGNLQEGDGRNNKLFTLLKNQAINCENYSELLFVAENINDLFSQPLGDGELVKTVRSVQKYKDEGKILLPGCEATALINRSTFQILSASELKLLTGLKLEHGAKRGKPFVLAQAAAPVFNMSVKTLRTAQSGLEQKGFLECYQRGERGKKHNTVVRLVQ